MSKTLKIDVLLAGALQAEVLPFLARLKRATAVDRGLWTGDFKGRKVAILRTGVGPSRAREALLRALSLLDLGMVISLGTCGALIDELARGEVLAARRVLDLDTAVEPVTGLRKVTLASVDRVVTRPERRAALASRGAEIVEMEVAGLVEALDQWAGRGHPRPRLSIIKVVSDGAGARPDPVFWIRYRPLALLLFSARALRLVNEGLVPAVARHLDDAATRQGGC